METRLVSIRSLKHCLALGTSVDTNTAMAAHGFRYTDHCHEIRVSWVVDLKLFLINILQVFSHYFGKNTALTVKK